MKNYKKIIKFKKPSPGNSFAEKCPELLTEWDDVLDPKNISFRTHHNISWKCRKHSHRWKASPHNRSQGDGCPYCSNRKVLKGFNDLASQCPSLLLEWDWEKNVVHPDEIMYKDTYKIHWKCALGHTWEISPAARVSKNASCKYCAGVMTWSGFNDFAKLYPDLVIWYNLDKNEKLPSEISSSHKNKLWWKCPVGHDFQKRTNELIKTKGEICDICSNRVLLAGFNDLATKFPKLAAELDAQASGVTAQEIKFNWARKYTWKCLKHGHSWDALLVNRVRLGVGCPYCSNQKFLKGFNDLLTMRPDIAAELNEPNLKAEDIPFGKNIELNWKCSKGHTWMTSLSSRCHNNSSCMICSGTNTSNIETDLRKRLITAQILDDQTVDDNHLIKIRWRTKTSMRVDFYGYYKNQQVVIEYDSFFYHQNKMEIDKDKALALLKEGYIVIRLREKKLPCLKIKHKNYYEILDVSLNTNTKYDQVVTDIGKILSSKK